MGRAIWGIVCLTLLIQNSVLWIKQHQAGQPLLQTLQILWMRLEQRLRQRQPIYSFQAVRWNLVTVIQKQWKVPSRKQSDRNTPRYFQKTVENVIPILRASGNKPCIIIPSLPRYILSRCYNDRGHCTNANEKDIPQMLLSGFWQLQNDPIKQLFVQGPLTISKS